MKKPPLNPSASLSLYTRWIQFHINPFVECIFFRAYSFFSVCALMCLRNPRRYYTANSYRFVSFPVCYLASYVSTVTSARDDSLRRRRSEPRTKCIRVYKCVCVLNAVQFNFTALHFDVISNAAGRFDARQPNRNAICWENTYIYIAHWNRLETLVLCDVA